MRSYPGTCRVGAMVLSVMIVACQSEIGPPNALNSPEDVMDRFLGALDALDVEEIMTTQSQDATMFFPHPNATFRLDGHTQIAEAMQSAFATARESAVASGITSPPFLGVVANARNRKVQPVGDRGAVVSWVVDRPGNFGRRTATLRLEADGIWRMVNFHSSNLRSVSTN